MDRDKAIDWVNKYRRLLEKRSLGVIQALPHYDCEDYLQDAYERALKSEKISAIKGISLSSVYWKKFRRWKKRALKSLDVNDCEEYQDEVFYDIRGSIPGPEEVLLRRESPHDHRDDILHDFMECLTRKQREVFSNIIGLSGGKMSYKEAAELLGTTCGAISQVVGRMEKRAEKFRNSRGPSDDDHFTREFCNKEALDGSEGGEFIVRNTSIGYQEDEEGGAFAGPA